MKNKLHIEKNNFFIILPLFLLFITLIFVGLQNIKINNSIEEIEKIQTTNKKIFNKSEIFLNKQNEFKLKQNRIDKKAERMFNISEMELWIQDFESKNPKLNIPNLNKNNIQ